jgi:mxaJ protein
MSSACHSLLAALLLLAAPAMARELRVCADPNNLPFSNQAGEGFENRIVALLAREMGAEPSYTWHAQRRGFIRETLKAGRCDVIPGTPANMEMLRTTAPYYRSTYVFAARADRDLRPASLNDPVLRTLTIGVQLIGDDGANAPPAHALARRGMIGNLRGFMVYGDYARPNPPARILDARVAGEIDLAAVWGPLAGWYARDAAVPLVLTPITPRIDGPMLPMVFDIAMGVRREDEALARELDAAMARNRAAIDGILAEYGVPRLDVATQRLGDAR